MRKQHPAPRKAGSVEAVLQTCGHDCSKSLWNWISEAVLPKAVLYMKNKTFYCHGWVSINQDDFTTNECIRYALLVQKYSLLFWRFFLTFILALGYIQFTSNKSTTHSQRLRMGNSRETNKTIKQNKKNKAHQIKCLLST